MDGDNGLVVYLDCDNEVAVYSNCDNGEVAVYLDCDKYIWFSPPPQTTCLGPWPRGYGDYFFLAGPFNPAGPPRSRGPRYATGL